MKNKKAYQTKANANQLYVTWNQKVQTMFDDRMSKPQTRTLTWMLVGIFLSKSVQLEDIAMKIPGEARLVSIARRLSRFLEVFSAPVRPSYEKIILPILERLAKTGKIHLIVDGSKVGFGHQLLMLSVAYRRRAIPVSWTWVRQQRGHSSAAVQLSLLTYVKTLLPANVQIELTGDSEFGAIDILKQLDGWKWKYALRQKSSHKIKRSTEVKGQISQWVAFGSLVLKPGEQCWLPNALLTQHHKYPTNLMAYWQQNQKEAWLIATNMTDLMTTMKAYKRRMWIEELFGDLKRHGFDLESTHLLHFLKLSRLTLLVVLLFVWLLSFGSQLIKRGFRSQVDRSDRRDLCLFQIGLRFIEFCLTNSRPFSINLLPVI